MSFLGDVGGFEKFNLKGMLSQVKDKPQRLLYGSADPASTKMWNGILGSDDKPIVDEWGGATKDRYKDAEAAGIDTKAGGTMHGIARTIAGMFAGNYAKGVMGGGGAPTGGSSPMQSPATQPNPYDVNLGGTKSVPMQSPATQPNPYDLKIPTSTGSSNMLSSDLLQSLTKAGLNSMGSGSGSPQPTAPQGGPSGFQGGSFFDNPGAQAISGLRKSGGILSSRSSR